MDDLKVIVCGAEENSESPPTDSATEAVPRKLSALSAAECNRHCLNTPAPFLALASFSSSAVVEPLQQAVHQLQTDAALDVVLLFPSAHRNSFKAWQKSPARLAALRENPSHRLAAVLFRVSRLEELGFAEVSDPVWDLIIRASQKPESCQAMPIAEDDPAGELRDSPPLPGLAPPDPDRSRSWLKSHLEGVSPEDLVPDVTSAPDGVALKAGLFQIHDYLEASHELSQSVQGRGRNAAGDYWHAIMHRREPDYSNSKYWFRNVGSHPIFGPLAETVDSLISQSDTSAAQTARQRLLSKGTWDPFAFVDFCQECNRGGDPELTLIAQHIQWAEMQLLLDQTYHDASN